MKFDDPVGLPDQPARSIVPWNRVAGSSRGRGARPCSTGRTLELTSGEGHVHASSGRLTKRDRCLVLVDPIAFERDCRALLAGYEVDETALRVDHEPLPLRRLLGGSIRDVVEAHGVRRVLIASRGPDTDERMLELTVDAALETAVVSMPRVGLTRSGAIVKRGFDLLVAGVAIVLGAPLFGLIALLVKLGSPGPVLFRQRRVGRGGRTFEMLKFRTMVEDAEAKKATLLELNEREGLFKIRDDPRITSIGHWLRATNLDELPQLINVLRGKMSLVGPRPLVPYEDAGIRGWRRCRLDVTPGVTGRSQVLGARISLAEMVVIDCLYVANWSLWRDITCMLSTAPLVILRRGV